MKATPDEIAHYAALALQRNGTVRGGKADPVCRPTRKQVRRRAELVAPSFAVEVTVPLATKVETNERGYWGNRHRRSRAARETWAKLVLVYRIQPPELPCRVTFTRLGGRQVDRADNLPTTCKSLLDAVCEWIGVDDSDDRLDVRYRQEPGPGGIGVRVRIEGPMCGGDR